jgi:peptide/nickel transport system permease protein
MTSFSIAQGEIVGGEPPMLPDAPEGGEIQAATASPLRLIGRTFVENRLALVGVGIVVALVLFCFIGPLLYHTDQTTPSLTLNNLGPGAGHPIGTDDNGFDILGRLMQGGQISIEIAFLVAAVAIIVGVIYGAVAGYFGKVTDGLMMRLVDVLLAIPTIYFYLDLSGIFKATELLLVFVIAGLSWLGPSRLVRGEVLTLRSREYVQAVKVMGGKPSRVILRHLVPNAIGTIVVQATFLIADAILILTTLEYLGLGLPATTPTWGGMLDEGTNYITDGYWWQIYPVMLIIVVTIVAFNLIGDALRDSLDVRLQRR